MPFLEGSIESIKAQTFTDWRLLILDHGSTDGSADLARQYAETDSRIQFKQVADAVGLAGLLNDGLANCDCDHVLRQDADDISLPRRMEITVKSFRAKPSLLLVGGAAIVIDHLGKNTGYMSGPSSHPAITAAEFFYNPVAHPTVAMNFPAMRRLGVAYGEDMLKVLPESPTITQLAEDYFLFGQMAFLGPCINIAHPLIKYRIHERSVSTSRRAEQTECTLEISRYLARSFCAMKDVEAFDPTPFCSHGEYVFDCGQSDYGREFEKMADSLRRGLGNSPELERELAFRRTLANRKSLRMSGRYFRFAHKHGIRGRERRIIRNWVLRKLRKKYVFKVEGFYRQKGRPDGT